MRVLLVGAGGTIGREVAVALKGGGHEVVEVSRRTQPLAVDLSQPDSIRAMYRAAGRLDAVVCAAAGEVKFAPLAKLSDGDFEFSLHNKLMGQVNLVRYGFEHVSDGGSFTLTSGILARSPMPGSGCAALANAAVEAFARAAALEAPRGIRVNVISPPWVTETLRALGMAGEGVARRRGRAGLRAQRGRPRDRRDHRTVRLSTAPRHAACSLRRVSPRAVRRRFPNTNGANAMKREELDNLLYQALETEKGGVQVYKTAIRCAQNSDLQEEWQKYLEQTENHERILTDRLHGVRPRPRARDARRARSCATSAQALVKPWRWRSQSGPPEAAELVAAECVVHAETKDHMNWELIGQCGGEAHRASRRRRSRTRTKRSRRKRTSTSTTRRAGPASCGSQSLGMKAVLPPPEEEKDVKTAIGAARAKQSRKEML